VVILVDGYNVSHAGWPGTPIAEQRRRLVDALTELVARTGADVRVVFDGGDVVEPPLVATTARTVRVTFSPPDVEADDVIVRGGRDPRTPARGRGLQRPPGARRVPAAWRQPPSLEPAARPPAPLTTIFPEKSGFPEESG